jgi:hypothetical protein
MYIDNICEESESMKLIFKEEVQEELIINFNNHEMTSMDIVSSLSLELELVA